MWSGWGVRTLSDRHPRYNPFSYQLGSIWPHDNVIIAAGLRRYGLDDEAARVIRAVLDAAARFQSMRLPELFAGLTREPGSFPAQYVGANVPQAWAAGSVIHALHVLIGAEADAPAGVLSLRPALPDWMTEVQVSNLGVGKATVDFTLQRRPDGTHHLDARTDAVRVVLDEIEPRPA
jgi:glycogen debranching enzyme